MSSSEIEASGMLSRPKESEFLKPGTSRDPKNISGVREDYGGLYLGLHKVCSEKYEIFHKWAFLLCSFGGRFWFVGRAMSLAVVCSGGVFQGWRCHVTASLVQGVGFGICGFRGGEFKLGFRFRNYC